MLSSSSVAARAIARRISSSASPSRREYSSTFPALYNFDRAGGGGFGGITGGGGGGGGGGGTGAFEVAAWPLSKANTILNIVPQGKRYVVERFGKLDAIQDSGYFFAVPFIDQIGE